MTEFMNIVANNDFGYTRIMHVTQALKSKAAVRYKGGKGVENPAITAAEAALEALTDDFKVWMQDEVNRLESAFRAFEQAPVETRDSSALFRAAHDLRGQAAVYGYPLAGEIAGSLSKMLDQIETDCLPITLIAHHVDAVKIVFRDNIRDSSNIMALNIVQGLRHAIQHVIANRQQKREQAAQAGYTAP